MRKYLYLAMAAASASVLAAPIVAQAAPAVHPKVLTIKKVRGTPVRPGAVLKASLVKGSSAVFTLGSGTSAITIKCKSASFTAKVIKNPTSPGTATESQTAQTLGKCTVSIAGATVKTIKALNLPYNATVSDKKGLPVTVTGRTKSKPIALTSTAFALGMNIVCNYSTPKIVGAASNKGNTITITKQSMTRAPGSNGLCPKTSLFSAKFGPVLDTSVKGNPAVFVN